MSLKKQLNFSGKKNMTKRNKSGLSCWFEKTNSKRGQIALWVIVAIIIVAGIILLYLVRRAPQPVELKALTIEQDIELCLIRAVNDAVDEMLPQGGFLQPKNYLIYNGTKIEYLCENPGFFETCKNQHPMLVNEMKKEISNYIEPYVEQCLEIEKKEAARKGGEMSYNDINFSVSMAPERIFVEISGDITITANGQTSRFDKFNAEVINPAYDLANAAIDIANSEAKYCNFQYVGYMAVYPDLDIRITKIASDKLYSIKHKTSGRTFNTAIKSCAIPIGI